MVATQVVDGSSGLLAVTPNKKLCPFEILGSNQRASMLAYSCVLRTLESRARPVGTSDAMACPFSIFLVAGGVSFWATFGAPPGSAYGREPYCPCKGLCQEAFIHLGFSLVHSANVLQAEDGRALYQRLCHVSNRAREIVSLGRP